MSIRTLLLPCLLFAFVLTGGLISNPLWAGNGSSPAIETVLPESTLFYASLEDKDAFLVAFQDTILWDICHEEEVKGLWLEIQKMFGGLIAANSPKERAEWSKAKPMLSRFYDELIKPVHGQVSVSVFYDESVYEASLEGFPNIQLLFAVNIGEGSKAYKENFESFITSLAQIDDPGADPLAMFENEMELKGSKFGTEEHEGSTLYTVSSLDEPVKASFGFHKDSFLIGFGYRCQSPLKRIIDGMESAPEKSLNTNTKFIKARGKLNPDNSSALVYLDLEGILDRYSTKIPAEAKAVMQALGVDAFQQFSFCTTIKNRVFRQSSLIAMGQPRVGLARLFSPQVQPLKSAELVPGDCMAYSTFLVDFDKMYQDFKTFMKENEKSKFEEMVSNFAVAKESMGIDIEAGLLNNVSGEVGMFIRKMNQGMFSVPQLYLFLQLRDSEAFQTLLTKGLGLAKMQIGDKLQLKEQTYQEQEFTSVTVPLPIPIELSPSWMIRDGFLWISLSANDMKSFILDLGKDKVSVTSSEHIQEVFEGMPTANRVGMFYSDTPRRFMTTYGSATSMLNFMQGVMAKQMGISFDMSALPMAETIGQHLRPVGGVCTVDDDGFSCVSDSVFGASMTTPFVAGFVAAIAIPNLLESKKLSNERIVAATMKQMNTAQLMFREKISKDMDGDNVGEFAADFLELTGDNTNGNLQPNAVGKMMINMMPVKQSPSWSEKNGYYYRIFIPSRDSAAGAVDDDEVQFAAVAWPVNFGKTGEAAYAITEDGTIYESTNADGLFDGQELPVELGDLFAIPFDADSISKGMGSFRKMK